MKDALHTVEIPFHLRFMQIVRPPEDWEEWLELGRAATTLDQKLGLLHGAFEVEMGYREMDPETYRREPYTYADRLEEFFKIADGWADHYLLKTGRNRYGDEPKYVVGLDKNWNRMIRTESEQRQVLARKAFDMLAAHFFRMPSIQENSHNRSDDEFQLLQWFVFGPLFPVVQNFFRVDKSAREKAKIRNLSYPWRESERSQQEKHAISFLIKLAKFLWSWRKPCIDRWDNESPDTKATHDKEEKESLVMQATVDDAKPWMIEVLAELHELSLLEKWILELDGPCLATLKKIALRNELSEHGGPVIKSRKVITIDEACYLGSAAGWLLKKHELAVREHKRLNAILSAERKKREADREIAQLEKA